MINPDSVPGVTVTVNVAGRPLREYADSDILDTPDRATRYIQASSGQMFEIVLEVDETTEWLGDVIGFRISIDGQWVDKSYLRKGSEKRRTTSKGVYISDAHIKRYCFNSLSIVSDDETIKLDAARLNGLGRIEVEVHHKWLGPITSGERSRNPRDGPGSVSEKAIKGQALSHSVGFADIVFKGLSNRRNNIPVDSCRRPATTFVFLYRSLENLKSMLIVPRTPSPDAQEVPKPLYLRDPATLSPGEIAALQQQASQAASQKVKQENMSRVKRERAHSIDQPRKMSQPRGGNTLFELEEDGNFRESETSARPARNLEIIELD